MARLHAALPVNAPGAFFVDDSCIDCDACRQLAPATFARSSRHAQSYVAAQPEGETATERALMALVACPTASIGTAPKRDARMASTAFPVRIEDDVWYCGWHAAASYGAFSYLIVRPGGNVLVDSPRAAKPLMRRLEELGGVRWMFLTHKDDVADHEVFARRFGCTRIMHAADAGRLGVERRIDGSAPVRLDADLMVIPVPGHTRGSMALLYRDKFLFTGDHLWWDEDYGRLDAGREVCWYSFEEQVRSVERLRAYEFEWVLPGHGRSWRAASAGGMRGEIERALTGLAEG
ncbi:MAG: fold metallo-hydrolase [Myxococcales bacterium]|nr:fold metallo-hydrolase [Myxococcales bacterium]